MIVCNCNNGISGKCFKKALQDQDIRQTLEDPTLKDMQKLSAVYGRASQHMDAERNIPIQEPRDFNCFSCVPEVSQIVREDGIPIAVDKLKTGIIETVRERREQRLQPYPVSTRPLTIRELESELGKLQPGPAENSVA